ncbi:hypothetical protein Aca07nite_54420 [Actinoplanes capillaceus]|uniref:PH domain-containing protein n=2 Tax=Actinoplanes campanulatus TaxID=113559 RepID=A0ABQ3WPM1_9ACTN|nr:hypothetical protein Aca07nite_54420 [Actinoplanes capillaceus]
MTEDSPWKGLGPGTGFKVSLVSMILLAGVSAATAVVSAVGGDPLGAVGFGAAAVFLGQLCGLCAHLWWRPRQAVAPQLVHDGLTFRYSGWSYYWMGGFAVLMALAFLLGGLGFLVAGGTTDLVVALVAFSGALFFGWVVVRLLYGGRGWLRLTAAGLEHHGPGFTHRLAWEHVADVRHAAERGSPLIIVHPMVTGVVDVTFTWPTRLGGRGGFMLPSMVIRGGWLADDPVVVLRTLQHYHGHPEHRGELASGAALQRVGQRRFGLRSSR